MAEHVLERTFATIDGHTFVDKYSVCVIFEPARLYKFSVEMQDESEQSVIGARVWGLMTLKDAIIARDEMLHNRRLFLKDKRNVEIKASKVA